MALQGRIILDFRVTRRSTVSAEIRGFWILIVHAANYGRKPVDVTEGADIATEHTPQIGAGLIHSLVINFLAWHVTSSGFLRS